MDLVPLVAAGVVAAAAVFYRLGISAWFDEAYSYGMTTQSWASFFGRWIWGAESNMVLYYLLMRAWLWLLADLHQAPIEVLLRLPSALFAVAAAVLVYLLGRRLFGRIGGLAASLLYSFNFLQMILAQTARAYTMEMFFLALSWYSLFAALETGRRRWWAVYIAASVLAVYSILFAGLVLLAQVVAAVLMLLVPGRWSERVRSSLPALSLSLGVAFLLVTPIGLDALLHGGPVWVPPAHLQDLLAFLVFLGGGSVLYERLVLAAAGLAAALALAAWVRPLAQFSGADRSSFAIAVALASWFAVPIALSFALTRPALNLHLFFPRYLVVVVPALCLLAGHAVANLRPRALGGLLAVLLLAVSWSPFSSYYRVAEVQSFRGPVLWMQANARPGDGLVCDPAVECAIPVLYYIEAYPGPARFAADSPGYFSWETNRSVELSQESLGRYARGHDRIFLLYAPLGRSAAAEGRDDALRAYMVQLGFVQVGQSEADGSAVPTVITLYQRNGG